MALPPFPQPKQCQRFFRGVIMKLASASGCSGQAIAHFSVPCRFGSKPRERTSASTSTDALSAFRSTAFLAGLGAIMGLLSEKVSRGIALPDSG